MIDNILNKSRLSRTDLSTIYKKTKELKLNISWLDLFRKSSREATINKIQKAIKPKPKKIIVLESLLETIKKLKINPNEYYVLNIDFTDGSRKHSTITALSKNKLIKAILDITADKEVTVGDNFSDATYGLLKGKTIKNFSLEKKEDFEKNQKSLFQNNRRRINKIKSGGFFPYTHRIQNKYVEELFEQLQIYKNNVLPENPDVCFISALKGQIPEDIIDKIKYDIRSEYVSTTIIKKICDKNNIYIKIRTDRENTKANIIEYGSKESKLKAEMCLIEKHYFKYIENTNITTYFLKNYDELKDMKNPYNFYMKNKRSSSRGLNSLMLVNELMKLKNSLLTPATYDLISQFKTIEIDDSKVYDFDTMKCCRLIKVDENDKVNETKKIFFDCETYKNQNNKHIPYMVSMIDDNDVKSFIGENCFDMFLEYISNKHGGRNIKNSCKLELYAHNSTYDASFMLGKLYKLQVLEKDNKYVSVKGFYFSKNKKVVDLLIKDSYRLITMKLSDIPDACGFGEEIQKEVMYYEMYNYKTIKRITAINKKELEKYINDFNEHSNISKDKLNDKRNTFYDNLYKWGCINNDGSYDLMKYSKIYCEQDCRVLKRGMEKWYDLFKEVDSRINVYNFYSLPSLANYFFKINRCFEGCYEMNGALGKFFSNFVSGGRVCSRYNKKHIVEDKNIQDFDAVSLYPSAMHLFNGYLKGIPKRIQTTNYNDLSKYDGYFVKVFIKSVGKKQPIPVINHYDKKNLRKEWTNKMAGKIAYLDKVSLEDAIEYQQIEFEIIDGYYYDEGFNTTIKEKIKHLFDKRLEAKKNKNDGLQLVFKLLMNSSYGKLIQKTPETEIRYVKDKDLLSYITKYYQHIKTWDDVKHSNYLRMETYKTLDESYSSPHLGSQVLSYSKRLMNRVICTANDHNMKIYYTDTDSMLLEEDDVLKLAEIYKEKYGRELIGKNLGQFHCDFDFKGMDDVKSIGLLVLGKKCYINKLQGIDKNGDKQYSWHIRLKGVSEDAIKHHIDELKKQDAIYDEWAMYKKLYDGESIEFDLNVNNKVRFQKGKDQEYGTFEGEFKRTIQF